eukprot:364500-Chlamydomonas_euryale.AAC.13
MSLGGHRRCRGCGRLPAAPPSPSGPELASTPPLNAQPRWRVLLMWPQSAAHSCRACWSCSALDGGSAHARRCRQRAADTHGAKPRRSRLKHALAGNVARFVLRGWQLCCGLWDGAPKARAFGVEGRGAARGTAF